MLSRGTRFRRSTFHGLGWTNAGEYRSGRLTRNVWGVLTMPQLWLDGYQGRGLSVKKILDGYKAVTDWPCADFFRVGHVESHRMLFGSWPFMVLLSFPIAI